MQILVRSIGSVGYGRRNVVERRFLHDAPVHEVRRGTAAVETALVLPIFLTVAFGICEFGYAIMVKNMATVATFEGARNGIIQGSTNSGVTSKVSSMLAAAIGSSASKANISIAVTPAAGNTDPQNCVENSNTGDVVTVTVSVPYDSIAIISGIFLKGKTMVVQCSMDHE